MRYPLIKKAGALALASLLIAPTGAVAQSNNSISGPLPITFDPNNIGEIILFMFNTCNGLGNSQMVNGPFVRLDVMDSDVTGPVPGGGGSGLGGGGQSGSGLIADSRLDYVTLDIRNFTDMIYSVPAEGSDGDISDQIGIDPGITLSVDIVAYSAADDTLTIDDVSSDYSQILDLGGFDAVMLFNGEERNRVNLECDMNMWRDDNGTPKFGVVVGNQTSRPDRAIFFWAAGPSPYAHQTLATAACDGANISTSSAAPAAADRPLHESREILTVGLGGDAAITYGDGALDQPANYTACGDTGGESPVLSLANYCDAGEATPENSDLVGTDETNLCNPAGGSASPPSISVLSVNEGNDSCVVSKYGFTMRLEPCPPE